jgi:hypothetical protein
MRLIQLAVVAALAFAGAGPAVGTPPPAEHGGGAGDEREQARSVELQGLVFPVFTETGQLKNYIFVNATMRVADGRDPWKYRENAHFIRDAILRRAHRVSFNVRGNFNQLDEALATRECLAAANEAMGEQGALIGMTFTQIAAQNGGRPPIETNR